MELIRNHYSHVTILLDALDEIDSKTRARFFGFLRKLTQQQPAVVKLLVSSRSEPDILDLFRGSDNFCIEAKHNTDDIRRYVAQEIGSRLLMPGGQAKKELRAKVENILVEKAAGM